MKLLTLFVAQLFITTLAFSSVESLKTLASDVEDMYRSNGIDNNYLDAKVFTPAAFEALIADKPSFAVASRREQKSTLRYCVFQTQGAYGDHFSNQKAWQLAGLWTTRIRKDKTISETLEITGEDLIAWEIISAPCGMAVIDEEGNVLVMQGMGVD